jgi:hypothetical protein
MILNLENFLDSKNQVLGRFWKNSKADVTPMDVWLLFYYEEFSTFLIHSFIGHL